MGLSRSKLEMPDMNQQVEQNLIGKFFKSLCVELKKTIDTIKENDPSKIDHGFRISQNEITCSFTVAYLTEKLPMIQSQFPWDTRYVFVYQTSEQPARLHAYFLTKPYDPQDGDIDYLNCYYDGSGDSERMFYHHLLEHLVLGTTPVNTTHNKFQ